MTERLLRCRRQSTLTVALVLQCTSTQSKSPGQAPEHSKAHETEQSTRDKIEPLCMSGRLFGCRWQSNSLMPRCGNEGKTTAFMIGISKMPMTRNSVLPPCEIARRSHMNGLSSSSPQGGRHQGEPDIAPAPKQLSNGSEARHAPWTAGNEHTMSL